MKNRWIGLLVTFCVAMLAGCSSKPKLTEAEKNTPPPPGPRDYAPPPPGATPGRTGGQVPAAPPPSTQGR